MNGSTDIRGRLSALHAEMRAQGIKVLGSNCFLEEYRTAPGMPPVDHGNRFYDVLFVYEISISDLDAAEHVGLSRSYEPERFQESPEDCSWTFPLIWTD